MHNLEQFTDVYAIVQPKFIAKCWLNDTAFDDIVITDEKLSDQDEETQMQYYQTECVHYWNGNNWVKEVIDYGSDCRNEWEIDLNTFKKIKGLEYINYDMQSSEMLAAQDKDYFYIIHGTTCYQDDVFPNLEVFDKQKYTLEQFKEHFNERASLDPITKAQRGLL